MSTDDPNEWPSKLALDHAELVERVPALQADACEINLNDRGVPVMIPPSHPLVRAFMKELDGRELRELEVLHTFNDGRQVMQPKDPDLRTARRKLHDTSMSYQVRVLYRAGLIGEAKLKPGILRMCSLSEILIARSEAKFWQKIVTKLEIMKREERRKEWQTAEGKRRRFAGALVAAFKGEEVS